MRTEDDREKAERRQDTEQKLIVARRIKTNLLEDMTRLEFEKLASEKRFEVFKLSNKPISRSGQPQQLILLVTNQKGEKVGIEASEYISETNKQIEIVELQLSAIETLILNYLREI